MKQFYHFSSAVNLNIRGHADIDFVDIPINTDAPLFLDVERIEAAEASELSKDCMKAIVDYFHELVQAVQSDDNTRLHNLIDGGGECNEFHLGYSQRQSRGRGSSATILYPIIRQMIDHGYFDRVQKISDLPLWTDNFASDRCSDLVARIIRLPLYHYTVEQCRHWNCLTYTATHYDGCYWDINTHNWKPFRFRAVAADGFPVLLCPQAFVGTHLLTSPEAFFQKYVLRQRQDDHLAQRSPLCHFSTDRYGNDKVKPPTRREICQQEVQGQSHKRFSYDVLSNSPHLLHEYHTDHQYQIRSGRLTMSPEEFDQILYVHKDETA